MALRRLVLAAPARRLAAAALARQRPPGGNAAGALADDIIAMTPDEQYVAFCSAANSLDPTRPDTNGSADVYRRHLPTGVTTLVSVNAAGTAPATAAARRRTTCASRSTAATSRS